MSCGKTTAQKPRAEQFFTEENQIFFVLCFPVMLSTHANFRRINELSENQHRIKEFS